MVEKIPVVSIDLITIYVSLKGHKNAKKIEQKTVPGRMEGVAKYEYKRGI